MRTMSTRLAAAFRLKPEATQRMSDASRIGWHRLTGFPGGPYRSS